MQTATVRLIRPAEPYVQRGRAAPTETYRPLVIGCVRLIRSAEAGGEWLVRVLRTGWIWPAAWSVGGPAGCSTQRRSTTELSDYGSVRPHLKPAGERLALGLLCGADLRPLGQGRPSMQLQYCDADMYGWSLLYQPKRLGGPAGGLAAVDAHPDIPELPAFYESPLELCDRLDFLDRSGIPARPLALVTRPEDFVVADPQQQGESPSHRNRFIPEGRFRPPADVSQLPGGNP
jgi:hypothetical protein